MCPPMPTSLYTPLNFNSKASRFIPRQNKTRSFENMVMSNFQRTRPECEIESFFTTCRQKRIDCFSVDGLCSLSNTVFEAMRCFYHFCPCQELSPALTEEDIQRGSKKRELDALRGHYMQEKGFKVIEIWECEWWRLYKTTNTVKLIKEGKLFGYVQYDIEVTEKLRENFTKFPLILKNTLVSKSDNGDLMKNYAEEERLLSQPRKMLIFSLILENGALITPLLLFYLQSSLFCKKIQRFVE